MYSSFYDSYTQRYISTHPCTGKSGTCTNPEKKKKTSSVLLLNRRSTQRPGPDDSPSLGRQQGALPFRLPAAVDPQVLLQLLPYLLLWIENVVRLASLVALDKNPVSRLASGRRIKRFDLLRILPVKKTSEISRS